VGEKKAHLLGAESKEGRGKADERADKLREVKAREVPVTITQV
jgi:hypothetical protein